MTEIFAPGEIERISQWLRKLNGGRRRKPDGSGRPNAGLCQLCPPIPTESVTWNRSATPAWRWEYIPRNPVSLRSPQRRRETHRNPGYSSGPDTNHRQERALRESRERYRDLFENANEMIATLNPAGQFVYVNRAWQSCFALGESSFSKLESLEMVFSPDCRSEVGRLFRLALEGRPVEHEPIRTHTFDGRVLDLELSLSRRQKADNPLAIRCMLRDITPQKQRERRLALQLVVSQIVGQSSSPEVASTRILESVCLSQQWDAAILWTVNADEDRLEFYSAWGAPGKRGEALIQGEHGPHHRARPRPARTGLGAGPSCVDGGSRARSHRGTAFRPGKRCFASWTRNWLGNSGEGRQPPHCGS